MNTKKRFLISVCGVRDGENIRELLATDIDILGFVFCSDSPQVVKMIPSNSGLQSGSLSATTWSGDK